jgi:HK97 family phage major capsid protein
VDLARLNDAAPLLLNHDPEKQIGVVENSRIDPTERKGRATVRFSRSDLGEEIFQDVKDGIRKNVSVGYRINEMTRGSMEDDNETFRATSWTPFEITIASVPADNSVGVGRSLETPKQDQKIMPTENQNPPASAPQAAVIPTATRAEVIVDEKSILANESARTSQIFAAGKRHGIDDATVTRYIGERKSAAEFNEHVLNELEKRHQPTPGGGDLDLGMSDKEAKRWSLSAAIRGKLSGNFDGIEAEASRALAKKLGQDPAGFYVPNDVKTRALNAGTASTGGYLIGEDVQTGSMIELLRNRMKVKQLGARMLSGLTADVTIPTIESAATAEVLGENVQISGSNQTFGQKALTPHRIGAKVPVSKQLILQSAANVDSIVTDDITRVIALEVDRQCLHGDGANGEIVGLVNTAGVNSVTFGATATWAKIVEFETAIAAANADLGSMAWLTDAAVRGAWKGIKKDSGSGIFLWESNEVNGYNAETSQQVVSNLVMFGVWTELVMGEFGALDIVVDNLTLADKHQIQIIANYMTDMVVRQPAAFAVSADAGNQ